MNASSLPAWRARQAHKKVHICHREHPRKEKGRMNCDDRQDGESLGEERALGTEGVSCMDSEKGQPSCGFRLEALAGESQLPRPLGGQKELLPAGEKGPCVDGNRELVVGSEVGRDGQT